ncbi:hypothetical protein [Streptomyces phaeochromogenes]|uniref:hypothetical protein n=1 Tax=Streptomyces phaeochromogenes TaxID=1923 RepID=UPI002DDAD0DA|nr:hypothetical protein [Streptomyces phaeochromogenes]WRZ29978.1 hypothetical protein OG931_20610 [Streptomyces phaeochromogenes]
MTTALNHAATPVAHRAAVDLAAVREQWGDLLAAISRRPAAEWPPREARGFLDRLAADDRAEDDDATPVEAVVGRLPLSIREHPAPLNLDALDAALSVERDLFDLADAVAEQVQRPAVDEYDRSNLACWHLPTSRDIGPAVVASAGSRAYGLHWAAVWLEGRALGEPAGDLFGPIPAPFAEHVASVAGRARRTVEQALNRDSRSTTLDYPCPWCGGPLTGVTQAGAIPAVFCARGEQCPAPAVLDRQRRVWQGAELVDLWLGVVAARE